MSFYITLPSGASTNLYPNNKVSNYITKLPKTLYLDDKWEVGLAKVIVKNSITNYLGYLELHSGKNTNKFDLVVGVNEPLETCFSKLATLSNNHLVYEKNNDTITLNLFNEQEEFSIGGQLPILLGLDPNTRYFRSRIRAHNKTQTRPLIFDLNKLYAEHQDIINIYTNIIGDQIVGNKKEKVLDTIAIQGNTNEMLMLENKNIFYSDVEQTEIDSINITARDNNGDLIRFKELSKFIVKLHFKQK